MVIFHIQFHTCILVLTTYLFIFMPYAELQRLICTLKLILCHLNLLFIKHFKKFKINVKLHMGTINKLGGIFNIQKWQKSEMFLAGFEPGTACTRVHCSTNWAIKAWWLSSWNQSTHKDVSLRTGNGPGSHITVTGVQEQGV